MAPVWAQALADRHALTRGAEIAAHAIGGGHDNDGDAAPSLKED
jgi:hypothetical protein